MIMKKNKYYSDVKYYTRDYDSSTKVLWKKKEKSAWKWLVIDIVGKSKNEKKRVCLKLISEYY